VNVIAIADSQKGAKSTGNIYFYLTMLDFTAQDLSKKNQLTALFSMDQSLYCSSRSVDPMEPTCARIMISGEALRVEPNSEEFKFATAAMISRHPASVNWLDTHDFFLCKLNISTVCVLDWYGGPHYVTIDDYYKANFDTKF
jgi:Pyridoxamine 5'-phosphate oxidase